LDALCAGLPAKALFSSPEMSLCGLKLLDMGSQEIVGILMWIDMVLTTLPF
jgi:hypothetical protein